MVDCPGVEKNIFAGGQKWQNFI